MDETFYAALGVADDADDEAIRRAYRERVKEHHPDVSDEPGDPRDFKRLTTARDVLVDPEERAKYDRLGHATYVDRNLSGGPWATDAAASGTDGPTEAPSGGNGGETTTEEGTARTATNRVRRDPEWNPGGDRRTWMGTDWSRETASVDTEDEGPSHETGDASWQQASETYRYTPSGVPTETATVGAGIRQIVQSVGPWLVVHAIFLLTAAGVAWFTYVRTEAMTALSIPSAAFGALLFGLALFLSALHVVSLVYA